MFRIHFSSVGKRVLGGYIDVDAETLGEVETIALLECRKRLGLRLLTLHYIDDLNYSVYEGFDVIGRVRIQVL